MHFKSILAAGVLAAVPAVASAVLIEFEPNDTLATAQPLGFVAPDANVGIFSLTPGDIDVFSVNLFVGDIILINTSPIPPGDSDPDTEIALLNSAGVIIATDDDEGETFGSSLSFLVTADGLYYGAITGFNDIDSVGDTFGGDSFNGDHTESGDYILSITLQDTVIPEPATLGLAGLAALGLVRRRK